MAREAWQSSYPGPYPRPRRRRFWPVVLLLFLSLLALQVLILRRARFAGPAAVPRVVEARGDLAADEKATIALFKSASPSVVFITTLARRGLGLLDVTEIPQGAGSGFLWDKDGHVVTNYHVIVDADTARVTLSDHSTLRATLVGAAPEKDLAVLKIEADAKKLLPIAVGTSKDLQVGQRVFAIGNPFGLDQSLTTGIISALGRSIQAVNGRQIEGVIQTDAAINPGNSGGPLLDSAGRLIGVNTAIASMTGSYSGIGFAVPVDTVNKVVPQLIQHGRLVRPQLGIALADDSIVQRLGLEGALVLRVNPGSTAEAAGMRGTRRDEDGAIVLGDVIERFGTTPIRSGDDLLNALENARPGERVPVGIIRDGRHQDVNITLRAP
ncbi:MAG TPA: trypsin-like peptidase domain-containing protein [Thermoanaerobaculia bacterium]|nr:trypsin-like peptidase domain-containing protein [Thermoanaerobaculia bacterium]